MFTKLTQKSPGTPNKSNISAQLTEYLCLNFKLLKSEEVRKNADNGALLTIDASGLGKLVVNLP